MKKILIITFALVSTFSISLMAKESSCIKCHLSKEQVSETSIAAAFMAGDVHRSMGLDCSDCHGGDPKIGFVEKDMSISMDEAKGFKSPPDKTSIPEFCARCHSDIEYMKKYNPRLPADQLQLYKTSIHGKLLYDNKDTRVAVCTDCHGAHGILAASDSRSSVYHNNVPMTCKKCHSDASYMKGYLVNGKQIPTNQFENYKKSVHGELVLQKGDKSAPACNNCHGNHGAAPPSLVSVSAACGECHATNRDFFNGSPHKDAWKTLGYPECEQCHGNHLIVAASDSLLGINKGALCIKCHDPGSDGYAVAEKLKSSIDSLKFALDKAEMTVKTAEQKGVESGQASFDLGPAKDDLTRVRSVTHTVDTSQVAELTGDGIKTADKVEATAIAALGDIRARQIGLAVSLILVLFMAFALWRKIRKVDSEADFEVKSK